MRIRFVDLKAQYRSIENEVKEGIDYVIQNTDFILGKSVQEFESEFAEFLGIKHAIGVGNGTDALILALLGLGVKSGDEVITAANTFIATVNAISLSGAKPVLVDMSPDTYNIDADKIEKVITPKTKVLIPVHLYGQACDMTKIMDIAHKHNLHIVEDACQAHGCTFDSKRVGTFGDYGCFSFYPGKNLGGYGDGGMVVTNDDSLAEQIRLLRNVGQKKKSYHKIIGYNSRLDSIQSAVLRVKLKYIDKWNTQRRDNADRYTQLLKDIPEVRTPFRKFDHVYHLYVIQTPLRDKLRGHLKNKGIETGIHYPIPIHLQEAYTGLGYKLGDFPETERYSKAILSLPMYPELTDEEISLVVNEIKKFLYENKIY